MTLLSCARAFGASAALVVAVGCSGTGRTNDGGADAAASSGGGAGATTASGGTGNVATGGRPANADGGTSSGTGGTSGTGGSASGSGGVGSGSGGIKGSGGAAEAGGPSAFEDIVTRAEFESLFPRRDAFYTYDDLVAAARTYPDFCNTGTLDDRKREAAAFLANVARETGELVYIEEIQKSDYCSSQASCACAPGKQYYGRGPIQISWNYNYCAAGTALGLDLRADPDLVARDATVAWQTGLWFWMTQTGAGTYTPHDAIALGHGFGETIQSINGSVECGGGNPGAVAQRVSFYQTYCTALGVDPGAALTC